MSALDEIVGCTLDEVTFSRFSYRLRFAGRRGDAACYVDLLGSGDVAANSAHRSGLEALSILLHPLVEHTVESVQLTGDRVVLRFVGFEGQRAEAVLFAGGGSPEGAFQLRVIDANSGELKDWQSVSDR